MLESIFRNLIFNAIKFTPKGGELHISSRQQPSGIVEVSVRDTGIGMNQSMVDRLYQLDGKVNRAGTEGEPGSGLGLVLCKEFVEKHGGKIWVESESGKGTTIHFTIPAKP
jgi:signal transduction histidine kinase